MTALTELSLAAQKAALRAKKVSSVELTQAHLAAMDAHRGLNAFITEMPEAALAEAEAADE